MSTASNGKIESEAAERISDSVTFTSDYSALADRQLVIEAVVERREAKLDVFTRLSEVVEDETAILASNTSSIPIVELGVAAGLLGRKMGRGLYSYQ